MTVTITITDPTATEATALAAYMNALYGTVVTPETIYEKLRATLADEPIAPVEVRQTIYETDTREDFDLTEVPPATIPDSPDPDVYAASLAGAPDFDSAGYPWNERIHAGSRATVADGTWRKKRGVSPEEVAAVEATLARDALTAHDERIGRYEEITGVPDAVAVEVPAPVQAQDAPEVPDAPVQAPDSPPPPPAATPNPFLAVMSRVGKAKLDKAQKDKLLTAAGALDDKGNPSILVLNKRSELIDGFVALLDSEGV